MLVALAGLKGGVGRSSTTILLAGEVYARGLPVLVVDLDRQHSSSGWWGPSAVKYGPGEEPTAEALRALDITGGIVLLDLPPTATDAGLAALEAADKVIAVSGPSWLELETLPALEVLVEIDGVIVTRVDKRLSLHRDGAERAAARYAERFLGIVPLRSEMQAAAAERRPPTRTSDVGIAGAEIVDRIVPWLG